MDDNIEEWMSQVLSQLKLWHYKRPSYALRRDQPALLIGLFKMDMLHHPRKAAISLGGHQAFRRLMHQHQFPAIAILVARRRRSGSKVALVSVSYGSVG